MSNITATTSATNQNADSSRLVCQQQAKVLSQQRMETGGSSVSVVIAPSETVTTTIIFSGHHDSAHIFHFFENRHALYFLRVAVFLLALIADYNCLFSVTVSKVLAGMCFAMEPGTQNGWIATIVLTASLPLVHQLWSLVDPDNGTPGAGDNLVSSVMRLFQGPGKAEAHAADLRELRRGGDLPAFFQRHKKELAETRTWHFYVDCLIRSTTCNF
jgi:hypothetical protein